MGKLEDGGVMQAEPDGYFGSQKRYGTQVDFAQALLERETPVFMEIDPKDVQSLVVGVIATHARWCMCQLFMEPGHWHFLDDDEVGDGRGVVGIWTYGVYS